MLTHKLIPIHNHQIRFWNTYRSFNKLAIFRKNSVEFIHHLGNLFLPSDAEKVALDEFIFVADLFLFKIELLVESLEFFSKGFYFVLGYFFSCLVLLEFGFFGVLELSWEEVYLALEVVFLCW